MIRVSRKALIVGSAVAAVLVVGATVAWLWPDPNAPDEALPDAVVVRSLDDPGEAEHAEAVAAVVRDLPRQFAAGDTSALSAQAREEFGDVTDALPAEATLEVDTSTWRRTGSVASVVATLTAPGEPTETYLVVVVYEDGAWRVSSTMAVPA